MDYDAAKKLFHAKAIGKTAFQPFTVPILARLCNEYRLPVNGTAQKPKGSKKKSDYIEAIISYRRTGGKNREHAATQDVSPMLVDTEPPEDKSGCGDNHEVPAPIRHGSPMQIDSLIKRHVHIRVYAHAKDYDCILQREVALEDNGDLSINQVQLVLGEQRHCQIIDPTNHKPMHLYKCNAVAAGDVLRLKKLADGYLRVVFK